MSRGGDSSFQRQKAQPWQGLDLHRSSRARSPSNRPGSLHVQRPAAPGSHAWTLRRAEQAAPPGRQSPQEFLPPKARPAPFRHWSTSCEPSPDLNSPPPPPCLSLRHLMEHRAINQRARDRAPLHSPAARLYSHGPGWQLRTTTRNKGVTRGRPGPDAALSRTIEVTAEPQVGADVDGAAQAGGGRARGTPARRHPFTGTKQSHMGNSTTGELVAPPHRRTGPPDVTWHQ